MQKGPREKILYVCCIQPNWDKNGKSDFLATVDVDPDSKTYCQVIHKAYTGNVNDELHHSGWNVCANCDRHGTCRDKLVLPALQSDRVYIFDIKNDRRAPQLFKVIDNKDMRALNCATPHTTHCLPTGDILISTMGDIDGNNKGDFVVIDGKTFEMKSTWTVGERAKFGYDFWYQPYHDVLVSSEWGAPKYFKKGYNVRDPIEAYGRSINVFKWSTHELIETIDLGVDGYVPLEIRFLHEPKASEGFVGIATQGNVFRFFKDFESDKWLAEKVIDIPAIRVENWISYKLSSLITDIIISLDDKYLYLSNWWQGDVRQYDIRDTKHPKLTGQVFLGGKLSKDSEVKVLDANFKQPDPVFVQNKRLYGGPQMLQLSLDGTRLYVTNSLFSPWDKQFYPDVIENGTKMVRLDIDLVNGGMKINESFLVEFNDDEDGPYLAHEMRCLLPFFCARRQF